MVKITLLGAGSFFSQPLFTDILNINELKEGIIGLVDVDKKRLDISVRILNTIMERMDKKGWQIKASVDRRKILPGSDYVINTIEVSGVQCVRYDNDIPARYGIDQCIGDTTGPGGIMKALRTVPVILDILRDCQVFCPNALFMNYTNPMSITMLACTRLTRMPMVGLCHSVQHTAKAMARYMHIPCESLRYRCGGINHIAWFTELKANGCDVYPELFRAMKNKSIYEQDSVRFDIMKHFGYFVTESSGHFSEYVPYYRKRSDLIKAFCQKEYLGQSGFYRKEWPKWRKEQDRRRMRMVAGREEIPLTRSHEYASFVIESHRFHKPTVIHATVPNVGLIDNLPFTGVVEVPVLVDGRGFTPTHFGLLPEQVAAMCRAHMPVYELCVQGILQCDRESIIHAMMLDPLSAAVCSPGEIREMAGQLFHAEKPFIPNWLQ